MENFGFGVRYYVSYYKVALRKSGPCSQTNGVSGRGTPCPGFKKATGPESTHSSEAGSEDDGSGRRKSWIGGLVSSRDNRERKEGGRGESQRGNLGPN
ncbi:hypothetical protein CMQ_4416 [Grosmannia clavigera kw1407]|uniref:Uncharacterized protein n=1 Tax=Grosmannia clavigera (strain kw1407 / UAMH 11150) TaxID=655863 RepID=F0XTX9_GROCL|nr:uncharacterized protein CMQ_4416 [Grosmannia clavigera kw1407]EFW98564.1 hypothetical protein CMQ_4416 [Grosmannia clavigera kw1407]